ncbi:expressed unknown protein [Seminavis robusta]|uniref:Uncharacterized protein n=1 Tax=Seminavis robusta TaxID=568900 RepID=A0A9N8ED57_9STRA|nr:expressed unknown protein [Seminavis robusta]|eukprot:Sro770_g200040.1 n/a (152) ;mRNA; f:38344-38799
MADESDDSDEWGMEELNIPAKKDKAADDEDAGKAQGDNEDDWSTPLQKEETKEQPPVKKEDDRPMIIVDMTQMTKEKIHSKFDRNSVNDAEAASALRKKLEQDYDSYAKDAALLGDGTVIPCGMSVWRGALTRLRDERPGHYFAPIFPPKK